MPARGSTQADKKSTNASEEPVLWCERYLEGVNTGQPASKCWTVSLHLQHDLHIRVGTSSFIILDMYTLVGST